MKMNPTGIYKEQYDRTARQFGFSDHVEFVSEFIASKRRAKERVRERKNTARIDWLYKNRELIVPVGLFLIMGIMYLFVLGMEATL